MARMCCLMRLATGLVLAAVVLAVVAAAYAPRLLSPVHQSPNMRLRDAAWIATSPSWLDRQACRCFGLCGLAHLRSDPPARRLPATADLLPSPATAPPASRAHKDKNDKDKNDHQNTAAHRNSWAMARPPPRLPTLSSSSSDGARPLRHVPSYVLDHAPLVHLSSAEQFWPSDIAEHLLHMSAVVAGHTLAAPLNLSSLHTVNKHGPDVSLHSLDDVETRPDWLHNRAGIPVAFTADNACAMPNAGADAAPAAPPPPPPASPRLLRTQYRLRGRPSRHHAAQPSLPPPREGESSAPAVLIVVDKGDGIVDAFWFFFYSYNLGPAVLGVRYGNHVGDWEHCLVRFHHGRPRAMFLSEHEGGQAFAWAAVPKHPRLFRRPVIFAAVGSHALYPRPGSHPYVLPFNLLADRTDRGPLWDPAANTLAYFHDYHYKSHSLAPAAENPSAPTGWFSFAGRWGDALYSLADRRQWRFFMQYHYVAGPNGPKAHSLDRRALCAPSARRCRIRDHIEPGATWY